MSPAGTSLDSGDWLGLLGTVLVAAAAIAGGWFAQRQAARDADELRKKADAEKQLRSAVFGYFKIVHNANVVMNSRYYLNLEVSTAEARSFAGDGLGVKVRPDLARSAVIEKLEIEDVAFLIGGPDQELVDRIQEWQIQSQKLELALDRYAERFQRYQDYCFANASSVSRADEGVVKFSFESRVNAVREAKLFELSEIIGRLIERYELQCESIQRIHEDYFSAAQKKFQRAFKVAKQSFPAFGEESPIG